MIIIFWILIGLIFYTYLGYTITLLLFNILKRKTPTSNAYNNYPHITHVVAAYNEASIIPEKLINNTTIDYPHEKITNLWITDGSSDNSLDLLHQSANFVVLHTPERLGKTAALNRAMTHVKTSITIFSDANTMLSRNAIKELVEPFNNDNIGCVAGEKHVVSKKRDAATASGEGHYWNYESFIKRMESNFGSTMGAVGELYAIRTHLFSPPANNTILDDFAVSMSIAEKGYKIHYAPKAVAKENSSFNIKEEMKRKVRIAAGGFQILFENTSLLNFFKHPRLSFQYVSHKVLRWLVVPLSLLAVFIVNMAIVATRPGYNIYFALWLSQLIFYFFSFLGYVFRNKPIRLKLLFLPYYFVMANYSQFKGLFRYSEGTQNAAWEKAKRNID